jgi:hemerythrin-like metal-binding protein
MAFKTGHPEIDQDHQDLAIIIDSVFESMEAEDGEADTCKTLLASFIDAARQHFLREEQILLDIGFPGYKAHCLYHDQLLNQAMEAKRKCEILVEQRQLRGCFEAMACFFVDDVIRGDMEFVSFMQERGIVDPPLHALS